MLPSFDAGSFAVCSSRKTKCHSLNLTWAEVSWNKPLLYLKLFPLVSLQKGRNNQQLPRNITKDPGAAEGKKHQG